MRRTVVTLLTGAILAGGISSAYAGPKEVIEWMKNPCVPTGDLEDDCQLP